MGALRPAAAQPFRQECFSHGCAQKGRQRKSTKNINISKYMTDVLPPVNSTYF